MLGATAMRSLCASFAVHNAQYGRAWRDAADSSRLLNAIGRASEAELFVLLAAFFRAGRHRGAPWLTSFALPPEMAGR